MEWWVTLLIVFAVIIILMATGLPVAFAFLLFNIFGVYIFWGGQAGLNQLILSLHTSLASFSYLPIPMFVLMGEAMFQSGMALKMIDAIDKWLGSLPGRLGILAIAAGTLFACLSGSTMGSTAMLGSLLTPEMEKRGYKKAMSLGPIMGVGGLAMIIPPSGLAVIFAAVAEISVGKLLVSGFLPGFLLAAFYAGYVIIRCRLQPSIAPAYTVSHEPVSRKISYTLKYVVPLGFIIFIVMGLIFLGVATPTESAAMGALAAFLLAAIYGNLNWTVIKKAFLGATRTSVMTLFIISGAIAFSQILVFSNATAGMMDFVTHIQVPPIVLMLIIQLVLIILGMFLAVVAIMMITVPIFMPIVYALGWDPIWFGLIFLINMELSMLTPPFGMLLFVMKGVAPKDTTMTDIIKAAVPFMFLDIACILIIIFFPSIATWLPNLMSAKG